MLALVVALTPALTARPLTPARAPLHAAGRPLQRRSGLLLAALSSSMPTQAQLEEMGVRDWPQTSQQGPFEDECAAGARRYVLEGSGSVRARTGLEPAADDEVLPISVGAMLEVSDACTLSWLPDEGCKEIVILTPEYKGPPLALVAGGFAAFCVLLVVVAGGG
jgi:hypothetical protein